LGIARKFNDAILTSQAYASITTSARPPASSIAAGAKKSDRGILACSSFRHDRCRRTDLRIAAMMRRVLRTTRLDSARSIDRVSWT